MWSSLLAAGSLLQHPAPGPRSADIFQTSSSPAPRRAPGARVSTPTFQVRGLSPAPRRSGTRRATPRSRPRQGSPSILLACLGDEPPFSSVVGRGEVTREIHAGEVEITRWGCDLQRQVGGRFRGRRGSGARTRVGSVTCPSTPGACTSYPREAQNTPETASSRPPPRPQAGRPQRHSPRLPATSGAALANSWRAGCGSSLWRCWGLACLRRDMARGSRRAPTSGRLHAARARSSELPPPPGRSAHVPAAPPRGPIHHGR